MNLILSPKANQTSEDITENASDIKLQGDLQQVSICYCSFNLAQNEGLSVLKSKQASSADQSTDKNKENILEAKTQVPIEKQKQKNDQKTSFEDCKINFEQGNFDIFLKELNK